MSPLPSPFSLIHAGGPLLLLSVCKLRAGTGSHVDTCVCPHGNTVLWASTGTPSIRHSPPSLGFAHSLPEARAIPPLSTQASCSLDRALISVLPLVGLPSLIRGALTVPPPHGASEKSIFTSLLFFFNQFVNKGLIVTRLGCGLWVLSEPQPQPLCCSSGPLPEALVSSCSWRGAGLALPHSVLTSRVVGAPSPLELRNWSFER